jgi:hypothetical protein
VKNTDCEHWQEGKTHEDYGKTKIVDHAAYQRRDESLQQAIGRSEDRDSESRAGRAKEIYRHHVDRNRQARCPEVTE